jgi:hypothetical protein
VTTQLPVLQFLIVFFPNPKENPLFFFLVLSPGPPGSGKNAGITVLGGSRLKA